MKRLTGKKIALTGSRKLEEMGQIIKNLGGEPIIRSAQGTMFLDDSQLEDDIRELIAGKYDWFIFTTGIGLETLYQKAIKLGLGEEFVTAMSEAKIAARGYKTVNKLKELGVTPLVRDDDGSTSGLIRMFANHCLQHQRVALQLHGDPAPVLIRFLAEQQADYKEILPYQHIPPQTEVLDQLVGEILRAEIDAVYFTSTPQVRYLLSHARKQGNFEKVIAAFAAKVVAVAVGKVTAAALTDEGVQRVVVPEHERMGSGIIALEKYYEENDPSRV